MEKTCEPLDQNLKNIHAFLISFPGQGHVNPLLRLGKRLATFGFFVTFATPEHAGAKIRKGNNITANDGPTPCGRGLLRFQFFDDGWDFNSPNRSDLDAYLAQLELIGRKKLPQLINEQPELGRPPVSCLIHNPFIPWVSDVARDMGIPSAMLWVQSAACFSAYYHYHNKLVPFPTEDDPGIDVRLPEVPILKHDEIPSYLYPNTAYPFLRRAILGQFKNLSNSFCVLIDSFKELESKIVDCMEEICGLSIRPVGPLFKSMPADDSIRADFFQVANDCMEFLDSKPARSVVYISFGSVVHLKQEQVDELAHGVLAAGVPFLWVKRPPPPEWPLEAHVLPKGFLEEVGERGKVVDWGPQEKVLNHPSVACFLTHCGWNSTVEALGSGVPVVAFPQFDDQETNAKFLVDVFKSGVRMSRGEDEGRVVGRDEIEKCLREATTSEELRKNAMRWKEAAETAVAEGGSSCQNIVEFVAEVVELSSKK